MSGPDTAARRMSTTAECHLLLSGVRGDVPIVILRVLLVATRAHLSPGHGMHCAVEVTETQSLSNLQQEWGAAIDFGCYRWFGRRCFVRVTDGQNLVGAAPQSVPHTRQVRNCYPKEEGGGHLWFVEKRGCRQTLVPACPNVSTGNGLSKLADSDLGWIFHNNLGADSVRQFRSSSSESPGHKTRSYHSVDLHVNRCSPPLTPTHHPVTQNAASVSRLAYHTRTKVGDSPVCRHLHVIHLLPSSVLQILQYERTHLFPKLRGGSESGTAFVSTKDYVAAAQVRECYPVHATSRSTWSQHQQRQRHQCQHQTTRA